MQSLPKHTNSYWTESTALPTFPKLDEQQLKVDIGIVGAGLTGMTAAYILAKEGLSVCLVDSDRILHGTTGHTTAKITAQHGLIYDELINHFGEEKARLYYEANQRAHIFIQNVTNELQIACDYTPEEAYIYTNEDKYVTKLKDEYKAYKQLGIPGQLTAYTSSLPFQVKSMLKMNQQAYFHPLLYGKALLQECKKLGVLIFEHTRAVDVEYNKNPAIVIDNGARISCNYAIQASHYPFYDGAGFYPTRMYASRSYLLLAKVKNPMTNGTYINAEKPARSIRPIQIDGDPYLLIGGDDHKTGQSKVPMDEHYKALKIFTENHFGLEKVVSQWSAQDYVTLDKIPYVGPVTSKQSNVFVATGFRKWGMTNSTNAALVICDSIVGEQNAYQSLFPPSRDQRIIPSVKNMLTYNADVTKHLVKGKLDHPKVDIDTLKNNEACITTKDGNRVGVYKDNQGMLHAVDTTCTHLGCEVTWNKAELSWDCPCHGSRFSIYGEVLNGPAVKSLQKVNFSL